MLNKVTLIGRVGKDPQVKQFSNGNSIVEFSIATDDSYKDKEGNKVEQTDWHNIKSTFKSLNSTIEKYVKKGMQVYVEGKIKTRSYDDKDGNKRYVTEIVADKVLFLSRPEANAGESQDTTSDDEKYNNDLPF